MNHNRTRQPPSYFTKIEQNANNRWKQLEADPELVGPWHQLFSQVQSPPHVLSELLQNADDAGATRAVARIVDGEFVFEHNGEDFTSDQFASLCRFAFSNKRTLHTIGFRGVGFKSTFSLGDDVDVLTPTLAVRFNRARFTLPIWLDSAPPATTTAVRVHVTDEYRLKELEQSLRQWATSPVSLLFFRNLRELEINGRQIAKKRIADGPISSSEVFSLTHLDSLNRKKTENLMVVQSDAQPFPEDAVREIRKERNIPDMQFPPCSVELVFGISGQERLYVVLPTGAVLDLPFSINAPFIQDPARYGIKEPSTSPTNRWLLQRAGKLAATVLTGWVGNSGVSLEDRAKAYGMLPKAERPGDDSSGRVTTCIRDAFFDQAKGQPVLLASDGTLEKAGGCFALPTDLYSVWNEDVLVPFFGSGTSKILSVVVSGDARLRLQAHGWLKYLSSDDVLNRLKADDARPPRPATWEKLHTLWTLVCKATNRYWDDRPKQVRIVPVQGSPHLHPSLEVIRLPSRRDQLSADDWKFVTDYSLAMDSDWLEWLAQLRSKKKEQNQAQDDPAIGLLGHIGLQDATATDTIVSQASRRLFRNKGIALKDCVRFAHIMAALKARVPEGFRYVTRDMTLREPSAQIVFDPNATVEDLAPAEWGEQHILHDAYSETFQSCTPQAWAEWANSKISQLHVSLPIVQRKNHCCGRSEFIETLKRRGLEGPDGYPYSSGDFYLEDWGIDNDVVSHWKRVESVRPDISAKAIVNVLKGPAHEWEEKLSAVAWQNGRVYRKQVSTQGIPAEWIVLYRSKACLPDTHGTLRQPTELLLRTPDTEPLMGVEPFVQSDLDTLGNRRLLDLLGVRSTPSGSKKIIERLEALSKATDALRLVVDISKLYEALDRIVARCAPAELQTAVDSFATKPLILSETGEWMTAGEISIFAGEDNQAPAIHHAFQALAMWPRLGVAERPAFERTLNWLRTLPSGERVDAAASSRVRLILKREPQRVWAECGHWLSLDQTWEPIQRLVNRQTMQNLAKWEGLAPAVKRITADLRMLSEIIWQRPPFAELRDLSDVVEFQVTEVREAGGKVDKPWLTELGSGLCRVRFEDEGRTAHVRRTAERLRQTAWKPFNRLEVTPYVDGTPAGTPITPRVLWQDVNLYVAANVSAAKLHKELADELARPFGDRSIQEAIVACIEHDAEYVAEYLADQFELEEQPDLPNAGQDNATGGKQALGGEAKKTPPGVEGTDKTAPGTSEGAGAAAADNDEDRDDEDADREDGTDALEATNESSAGSDEADSTKTRKPPAPPKPELMDRYAAIQGFKWHAGEKCYYHLDGRWIEKAETPFHWIEMSSGGDPMRRFWVQEQTLTHGVEVPAEVWSLIRSEPKTSALLVRDGVEAPVVLTGEELIALQVEKQITLYPSRYLIRESES
jgi:hypothetical protein